MPMLFRNFILCLIFFYTSQGLGSSFATFKKHYLAKDYAKAITSVNEHSPKGLGNFALGITHYKMGSFKQAIKKLDIAFGEKIDLNDYIYFYEGVSYLKLNKYKNAEHLLEKVISMKEESSKKEEARFYLAQSLMKRNKIKQAKKHLIRLNRSMRNNRIFRPLILWELARIDVKQNKTWRACKWAKILYKKFPNHELTKDWNIDLSKAQIEGKTLGCKTTLADKRSRVRRLQYEGQSERARKEIALLENTEAIPKVDLDILLAAYLMQDGMIKESHDLLVKHYGKHMEHSYLDLFATIQSRLGSHEGSTRTYDYMNMIRLPRKLKEKAIFNSAFVSFQNQKYDLASNKFGELMIRTSNNYFIKNAQWYKYWGNYLSGKYQSAVDGFLRIIKNRHQDIRKIKYYLALSYLNTNRQEDAKAILEEILHDRYDFYSLVAANRLEGLKKVRSSVTIKPKEILSHYSKNNNSNDNQAFSSKFKDRLKKANDLESLGFYDLAKAELRYIERRTSEQSDLRTLMANYTKIEAWDRASYLGEIFFKKDMNSRPVATNRGVWENTYPKAYEDYVLASSSDFNVEKELIWAIIKTESNYRKDAISPVGALGLMQMMPYTGKNLAIMLNISPFNAEVLQNPKLNIKFGTRYLKRLLDQFDNSIVLASAAYNAGPHRVNRWLTNFNNLNTDEFIDHIPFRQTRGYVKKVIKHYHIYKMLYSKNMTNQSFAFLSKPLKIKANSKHIYKEDWSDIKAMKKNKQSHLMVGWDNEFVYDKR